jgi:DivIVA domain-containing protein
VVPLAVLVLVLLVLGAVAVVAAGRGGRLTPPAGAAAHDRAPLALPGPAEPVGPEDVAQLRFALAFRGYRMDEVDLAMDRLGAELAERDARIAELEALADVDEQDRPPPGPVHAG